MFNLKSHKTVADSDLLRIELNAFDIYKLENGYQIKVGDETLSVQTFSECIKLIDGATRELISYIWESWNNLIKITERLLLGNGKNSGTIDNLIFLKSVYNAYKLADHFSDLENHKKYLEKLLDSDITSADDHLVLHFNQEFITIQSVHKLIINELYRKKLVNQFMRLTKEAQISGPWANLDLPMKERTWDWDEGEEAYFKNRQDSKREQIRYNPEDATSSGFYFVWQDLSRDPYKFENMDTDSPYKSLSNMTVA